MEPKNLDEIVQDQKDYLEGMNERISSFEERCEDYWDKVLDTIYGPESEEGSNH